MSNVRRISAALSCVMLLSSVASAQNTPSGPPPSQPTAPGSPSVAQPHPRPSDLVCVMLFDQYIGRSGKIPGDSVAAAIHLVAVRGRNNGFWRTVLREFDKSCEPDGDRTVRRQTLAVLSKMLTYDGWSRWNQEQDEREAAAASYLALGPEVLDQIIARTRQADRHEINAFVLAVRASHDPRGKEFLRGILQRGDNIQRSPFVEPNVTIPSENVVHDETLFYAAVGLAELGDPTGVEWLIAHAESLAGESQIHHAPHRGFSVGGCRECCRHALADLSGLSQPPMTKTQWQEWWSANKSDYTPAGRVHLRIL